MFLKRIEMQGFKSFADRSVISFDKEITGIVGPNGCGKSNISDAVRWVLGEQSVKSLRGSTMSDVIFSGSGQRKMVNFAEVTLVFDNTERFLQTDYAEIEITRRLHRTTGESEYLINKTTCRLKDIVDLILDSGLGKDSLSIISQGNIINFAEARPSDRRGLFEEAAGVAKYKKRKHESTQKLDRTQENLDRLVDIISEIEKQVLPLRRQAEKARNYLTLKDELQEIEIAVLVFEIHDLQKQAEEIETNIRTLAADNVIQSAQMNTLDNAIADLNAELKELNGDINVLQEQMLRNVHEIQTLDSRKVELDERRKYQIEQSQDQSKLEQMRQLLDEARFEYNDRQGRYESLNAQLRLYNQESEKLNSAVSELQQKTAYSLENTRRLENRKEVLKAQLNAPFQNQAGVQAIVDAKDSLPGILDVTASAFKPHQGYENALTAALGGAMYHIITADDESAVRAINFLKRNKSGRATFLPQSIMKPLHVNQESLIVCNNTKGYLGVAADFVYYDNIFKPICNALLNNVVVVDDINNGKVLANLLNYRYKIVTLDGDIIHRGGSLSGGFQKELYSPLTLQSEFDGIAQKIEDSRAIYDDYQLKLTNARKDLANVSENTVQSQLLIAQIEPILDAKRAKYERLKDEFDTLNPNDLESDGTFFDELLTSLNDAYALRDSINASIKLKNDRRVKCTSELERKDTQLRQLRRELTALQANEHSLDVEKVRLQTQKENLLLRLNSEYQMTMEYATSLEHDIDLDSAKQRVLALRTQIQELGNINMDAPEQYEETNERYTVLQAQYEELTQSKNSILEAIADMDVVMKEQFVTTFNKINSELQNVFTVLFGGGKARLFLEDENDILETGIDIDIQPPGKNVQNIRLFSGGEKSLIAICVLFAILKARPIPLCIFDEVEAALDQGNVERFAKYIHEFQADTQFIVITHRPGTMEQCDVLYGVTMPQEGVSQLLMVRLEDAIDMSQENEVPLS